MRAQSLRRHRVSQVERGGRTSSEQLQGQGMAVRRLDCKVNSRTSLEQEGDSIPLLPTTWMAMFRRGQSTSEVSMVLMSCGCSMGGRYSLTSSGETPENETSTVP